MQHQPGARVIDNIAALERLLEGLASVESDEGGGLTELEHGLQCAAVLAEHAPGDTALQVAGLVHDIGHGLGGADAHGDAGAAAVRGLLGARVANLVALHVPAKRYLVSIEGGYVGELSPTSIETLRLQGGPMSAVEVAAFEADPDARDAVLLRRADEAAKVPGRPVPGLDAWRAALRSVAAGA